MRIAHIAPPFERVPPRKYGGTEKVVADLVNAQVRQGHDVTLFASGDSQTLARLVPIVEQSLWHQDVQYGDLMPFCAAALGKVASRLSEFDVVHNHMDYLAFPLARLAPQPVVTTLHGRLDLPELQPLYHEFRELPLVSISDAQRRPLPHARWTATVHHGMDVPAFTWSRAPGKYLAFLGRIAPEKGVDTAIRVARAAGLRLKIAARLPLPDKNNAEACRDQEYYERVVLPLLAGDDVEFLGELGGAAKNEFLQDASALLFPIQWPEPFGLVMIEALAAGTPVIALANGSVPEVIDDGVTGFVCRSEGEMVDAAGRLGELNRSRCRSEAETRFSSGLMAERYDNVYEALLGMPVLASARERPLAVAAVPAAWRH